MCKTKCVHLSVFVKFSHTKTRATLVNLIHFHAADCVCWMLIMLGDDAVSRLLQCLLHEEGETTIKILLCTSELYDIIHHAGIRQKVKHKCGAKLRAHGT